MAHLEEKARVLSLCELGQQRSSWPLSTLASLLELGSSLDVERLVVRAVSAGVLGAKINQETDQVEIEHAAQRNKQVDWVQLSGKVHAWRDGIATVVASFAQARVAGV